MKALGLALGYDLLLPASPGGFLKPPSSGLLNPPLRSAHITLSASPS